MKSTKKTSIRPFTRQFYLGNGWRMFLGLMQTIMNAGANLLVAWLIQQIIDLIAGVDTGFTLTDLVVLTVIGLAGFIVMFTFDYFSRPVFISRGIGQYKNYVFGELTKKNISAFSGEVLTRSSIRSIE